MMRTVMEQRYMKFAGVMSMAVGISVFISARSFAQTNTDFRGELESVASAAADGTNHNVVYVNFNKSGSD